MEITLVQIPGNGASFVTVAEGTTLAQFASTYNLTSRSLCVNDQLIDPSDWENTILRDGDEVFATKPVKGA